MDKAKTQLLQGRQGRREGKGEGEGEVGRNGWNNLAARARRLRGGGATARALAFGLALTSNTGGVLAVDSRLRASMRRAELPTAAKLSSEICGLTVSVKGEAPLPSAACGEKTSLKQGVAWCNGGPSFVRASVGNVKRDEKIAQKKWSQVFDLGCVDNRESLVLTLFDDLQSAMVSCEVGKVEDLSGGIGGVCSGSGGAKLTFMVEHAAGSTDGPGQALTARFLQENSTTSPALAPTPGPVAIVVTGNPTVAASAPTEAPFVPEATPSPVLAVTSAPVPEPTPNPTAMPIVAPTPEPTAEPIMVPPTPAPVNPTPSPTVTPVASTPEPTPEATVEVTAGKTPAPVAPLTPEPTLKVTTAPVTPTPPPVAATTPAPADLPTSEPSAATTTPGPILTTAPMQAPTPAPSEPTPAPILAPSSISLTDPPILPTNAPAVEATLFPTPAAVATPAPSDPAETDECKAECVTYDTASEWSGTYYDPTCGGTGVLGGCNLDSTDAAFLDCRWCVIDRETYETSTGDSVDWPDCPCCVAEEAGLADKSDACTNEEIETPAPTSSLIISLDLSTSANDPLLMMISLDYEECSASGIAVVDEGKRIIEVTEFKQSDGTCGTGFDILYGTECESEQTEYTWDYGDNVFSYFYSCPDETSSNGRRRMSIAIPRRKLSEGSLTTSYKSDTLLCNDGTRFVSLTNLEGEDEGLVYALAGATGFDEITGKQNSLSGGDYCAEDLTTIATAVLETGIDNVLEEPDVEPTGSDSISDLIIIGVACGLVAVLLCGCLCCYRHRRGKDSRVVQLRRNLGYTSDMEAKGEGNFGPTNTHVAITRGDRANVTPAMLATTSYQPQAYPERGHHRAPSEAPSSVIEDNIANNYRPKTAAKNWEKRKVHKDLTKPASQQHIIGAGPTSEELKTENNTQMAQSEHLSEHSLSQLVVKKTSSGSAGAHPSAAQAQYGYQFEEEGEEEEATDEDEDEDEDDRSAGTGVSGPSKYAPSGYAPSSHHDGVTHDLMSQYEPSVYEADSTYDPSLYGPSLYGRESEYGDESSSYSYNHDARSSQRSGYGGAAGGGSGGGGGAPQGGGGGAPHGGNPRGRVGHISGKSMGSIADTAAQSHLGSVQEMDDGGDSAYAPSESYVSSYVSSEDDDGRLTAVAAGSDGTGGYSSSRHNARRSGQEAATNGGHSGFSTSSAGEASRRGGGAGSGLEGGVSTEFDDDGGSFYSEDDPSGRGTPLTDVDDRNNGGKRQWQ